jgi:uncharacterized OB-fold protein
MFCDPTADSKKNRAMVETGAGKVYIIGVSSTDEGAKIARQMVDEGVALIELCGAFGYDGAKKVHDAVGDKVAVGMMVHQVWNAPQITKLLEGV